MINFKLSHIRTLLPAILVALCLSAPGRTQAQGATQAQTPPPLPAFRGGRTEAPIDVTGYWVSVITQDWRWRMVTPAKGDYAGVPINAEAKRVGDTWDPAKDDAAGMQCRSYGAPGLMHAPTRMHITWQDEDTLKVETDYGTQTRLFHFGNGKGPAGPGTLQGNSAAEWETPRPATEGGAPQSGDLKVVTNHFSGGYLRKNGVPYGTGAVLTEYWDAFKESNGDQRMMISIRVTDPQYLSAPWLTVVQFKKEPNASKWDPTPCSASW